MPPDAVHNDIVFVYVTFPDEAAAQRVADAMSAAQLATAVRIRGPIAGVTELHGKLQPGTEYAAYIETRRALAGHVIAAARTMHPYRIPCFLILPAGNDDDLDWASAQT